MAVVNRANDTVGTTNKDAEFNWELFQDYKSGDRATWAIEAADDWAFYNGAIFRTADANALISNRSPVPSVNVLKQPISQLISQLTSNNPRFTATARENSDSSLNATVADTFQYIWDISNGNQRLKSAIKDYEVGGIGALIAYQDPNADNGKGEIFIRDVDPQDLYIDPNSKNPNSSDASHILVVQQYNKRQIRDLYPRFNFKGAKDTREDYHVQHDRYEENEQTTKAFKFSNLSDTEGQKIYDVMDRYTKIKVKRFHVFDPFTDFEKILTKEEFEDFKEKIAVGSIKDGGEPEYSTKQTDVRQLQGILEGINKYYRDIGRTDQNNKYIVLPNGQPSPTVSESGQDLTIDQNGQKTGILVELFQIKFGDLLERGVIKLNEVQLTRIQRVLTIGRKLFFKGIMEISEYPIVTFMLHHNRNPFAYGDVRLVKSLVEQLNKIESLIITHAINTTNLKVFVPEGGTDKKKLNENWGKSGSQFFYYNADDNKAGVHIVAPPPLPNEVYALRQNYINEIQNEIGAFAFQDGDVSQAPPTVGGTLLMDEFGQRRTKSKKDDIEEALNQLAKVVLQFIPLTYTERKVIRITQPNHKTGEIVLNDFNGIEIANDVSNWDYDVKVVSGSMLPSNRWARTDKLTEWWDRGIIRDNALIIRESDIPNAEEIIENEGTIAQLQQALGQAQQQIKDLEGDLQTASRKAINADERTQVAKTSANLKVLQGKMENAVNTGTQRINDQVKIITNELKESTRKDGKE